MALPLLVCFVADAEVLHLMKALYCFRRPPLLLLCSVLYYTDERSRLHKSFKILWSADGPAASSLFCCFDTSDFYFYCREVGFFVPLYLQDDSLLQLSYEPWERSLFQEIDQSMG